MLWYPTLSTTWWQIHIENFMYKDQSMIGPVVHATIDSGTPFIKIPAKSYQMLIAQIKLDNPRQVFCNTDEVCFFYDSCNSGVHNVDNLKFTFDGEYFFNLSPHSYLVDETANGFEVCVIAIQQSPEPSFILGALFLR